MVYNKKLYNQFVKNLADKGFDYITELDSSNFKNDEYLLDLMLAAGEIIDAKSVYAKNVILAGRDFSNISFEEKINIAQTMKEVQMEERNRFLALISDKLKETESASEKE